MNSLIVKLYIETSNYFFENEDEYNKMAKAFNSYGDGHVCERIVDIFEMEEHVLMTRASTSWIVRRYIGR